MEQQQQDRAEPASEGAAAAAEQNPETIANKNKASLEKFGTPGAIVVAGILVAGAIIFTNNGGGSVAEAPTGGNGAPDQPSQEELLELAEMQKDDWVLGNRDAEVYVLEFSDTECPFCKRFHETMNRIVEEYNGEVAWVYRHFPLAQLHRKAEREAEALECAGDLAGNDGFWEYTNRLYEIAPSNDGLIDEQLPQIAAEVGINVEDFTECLSSGKFAQNVQDDFNNARSLGGRGTPHSLIIAGDQLIPIQGAQPFETVKAAIDSVL